MPQIVILDDRVTNQRILARLAQSVAPDIAVEAFGDPREALSWLESNDADLVITDFKMPHFDGAEVTRRLRAKSRTADVPIVVVTVYDDRAFRLLALEAGATDFLLAPVDHVEFRTRVRNLLSLRRHQVEIKRHAEQLRQDLEASVKLRTDLVRQSRDALAQVIDTVPAMVTAADRDGRLVFVNAAQAAFVARSQADVVGNHVNELFGVERGTLSAQLDTDVFVRGEQITGFEEKIPRTDGSIVYLSTTKTPIRDSNGTISAILTTSIDVTERKRAEERLLHLAKHDPLTALPNRAYLGERVRERCGFVEAGDNIFALYFLDLDRFKAVNDALGHQLGDQLISQVGRRLRSAMRDEDLVARLGGDEFAVLQHSASGASDAGRLASRILKLFEKPFRVGYKNVSVNASIGVTLFPRDSTDADELLRNADLAMYRAKRTGGAVFCFFDPEMDAAARRAMVLESELRRALARREFELVWQPQVSLRSGRISGAEALLRWRHAEKGIIPPTQFLHLAEETGLIAPITEWTLAAACAQGVSWAKRRPGGLRVSANLSPSVFATRDVRDMVFEALGSTGLPPSLLDLEITERVLVGKVDVVASTLRTLREVGVTFSIDDFGTGYSSLAYAKNWPVQRLKIDQTFVTNIDSDRTNAAIVASIVSLAHGLGMETIAEGVETAEQVVALRRLGCDEIQGYFVREPIPAEELTTMLDADVVHLAAG